MPMQAYPNVLLLAMIALCLLAPLAAWGAVVWWRRRVGLASVFVLIAVEAAIMAGLRFLFL